MKQSSRILLITITTLLFSSCVQKGCNKAFKESAEKIQLPESLEIYNSNLKRADFGAGNKNFPFKIFTTINVSCATCILKLSERDRFKKETGDCSKVLLAPICTSKDKFELIKFLFENDRVGEVNFPLLLDGTNSFKTLNSRFSDDASGFAVLTNSNNEVLLTGNPIESKSDRRLFLNKICNIKTQ